VGGLGDKDFLRVTTKEPTDVGEQRARLGALIDELVDQGSLPKGIAFAQRAVRRLAGDVQVRVLFPDPESTRGYVPVTELAVISVGERLTCATLLYCTLARLRARGRGRQDQPTGVLLCDNPIGKASRPKFIELQREVARKMGIQLLYFTGVNDFEAIRMLPGCIRLKNGRRDMRTGYHHVEHERDAIVSELSGNGAGEGVVEGVRLVQETPIDPIPSALKVV
jgi:hypothetical protein